MFDVTIVLFLSLISEYVEKKANLNVRSIHDKLHFDDILLT